MGVHTNIELHARETAEEGELLSVAALVQNLTDGPKYITVTARVDSTELIFSPSYLLIDGHKTGGFRSATFNMPGQAVQISAGSWYLYEAPDKWALDDQDSINISLSAEPPNGEPPEEEDGRKMITIQMGITGNPPGWPQYTHWGCWYVDPILGLVGDGQWHSKGEFITFANVNTGGYPTAMIINSWDDPQVPSDWFNGGAFWGEDGRSYLFNIESGIVYVLANGEEPNGEEPPDDEKTWLEKNQTLVLGGIAGITILAVVLSRR